jgi:acyl-CoA synthetase (AMP-forming)/AMP-acid ligase II/thioesterase domain-containing protein/acyl carrier protein
LVEQRTTNGPAVRAALRPTTLVDLLRQRALEEAPRRLYTFLGEAGEEEGLTYGELDRRARRIGAMLQERVRAGERVLLLYAPGLDYIAGFFGCIYAGVVAIPAYPPDPLRLERTLPRLHAIVADARASVVLTTSPLLAMVSSLKEQAPELRTLQWLTTDELPIHSEEAWRPPAITRETLAFLQYTSGSTGSPKGVMLTHDNLLHNLRLITDAFQVHRDTVGLLWLPPYHDMGLIGGILEPLFAGFEMALMSPATFLGRPFRWLEAISNRRATLAGGPNFAFELCARKITPEERQGLDLSCWELAFCGAEPIRASTLERFTETFAPRGFRREAFYPCYGLAEGTLFVSGGDRRQPYTLHTLAAGPGTPGTSTYVGCGRTQPGQELLIVDPETLEPRAPGEVGEIWLRGPSVALGYWKKPEETEHTFYARPARGGSEHYLRTGDLGLLLEDGELLVTGRMKDLLIIRGQNYYPQDLEQTVEHSHSELRPGCSAVFSLDTEEGEQVAVAVEVSRRLASSPEPRTFAAISDAIRQAIASQHELHTHTIALLAPGTLPKTSSGKVQRGACRTALLSGSLELLWRGTLERPTPTEEYVAPRTEMEQFVARIFSEVLGEERVSAHDDFFVLGGHSLLATQVVTRLRASFGVELAVRTLFELRTVAALASHLEALRSPARDGAVPQEPKLSREGIEQVLAEIWRDVLSVEHLAVNDSFFALGGSSLSSILMLARVQERLGVEVPLERLLAAPSFKELADSIESLANAEAAAPTLRHASEPHGKEAPARPPPLKRRLREEPLPLSFAQQRLWFLEQFRPGGTAYNIPIALRLSGPLDVDALRRAFEEVVRRHESLRTTFTLQQGPPLQIIHPPTGWELPVKELPAMPEADCESSVRELATWWARQPFNLEKGPLLRSDLLRLSANSHVLLLNLHHIISDGWSMGVLVRELTALYGAFSEGRPSPLPELSIQYGDFALWQRQWMTAEALRTQLDYWKKRLAGAPALWLPTDKPRPALPSQRGQCYFFKLPRTLISTLERLGQQQGATLYMVLLAAFKALLYRWSAQSDLCIGTPIANRTRPQLEPLIGFFVNTLVMRTDLSGDPSFMQLLERVKKAALSAYTHQDVPFERLVEALGAERDPSRAPLFQVMFALQNAPLQMPMLSGLRVEMMPLQTGTSKFDLTLSLMEWAGEFEGQLEYSTDLFEESTIERLANHFHGLLEALAADPTLRLSQYAMPPEAGMRQSFEERASPQRSRLEVPEFVAPRTHLEQELAEIWREVLSAERIGVNDSFFTLGGSSLSSVLMLARVRERLGVEVSLEQFFAAPSLAALAACVEARAREAEPSEPGAPLVLLERGGDGRPFFCVHPVSGDVSCYAELARRVGANRPFYGLQARDFEVDMRPSTSIEHLASLYLESVRRVQPAGPYLLGGWSMGGIIAFEMALQLEQQGERVELLALIDANAHILGSRPPEESIDKLVNAFFTSELQQAPASERLQALRRRIERHLRAIWSYVPRPYGGQLTLLRTHHTPEPFLREQDNGWRPLARGGVEVHELPGDHHSILRVPDVEALAQRLRESLARAMQRQPPLHG